MIISTASNARTQLNRWHCERIDWKPSEVRSKSSIPPCFPCLRYHLRTRCSCDFILYHTILQRDSCLSARYCEPFPVFLLLTFLPSSPLASFLAFLLAASSCTYYVGKLSLGMVWGTEKGQVYVNRRARTSVDDDFMCTRFFFTKSCPRQMAPADFLTPPCAPA